MRTVWTYAACWTARGLAVDRHPPRNRQLLLPQCRAVRQSRLWRSMAYPKALM
jgi:hypothetical protein